MSKKLCKIMPPVVQRFLYGTRVYSEGEVIAILKELNKELDEIPVNPKTSEGFKLGQAFAYANCENLIRHKINQLRSEE